MKASNSILNYSLALLMIAAATTVQAQNKTDDKKPEPKPNATLTEEIEIVRPYKPVLADAVKIRRTPDLNNYAPFKPSLTYSVIDKRFELNTDIRQLQAQQLTAAKEDQLKNNFVKIGAGNLNTGLGELYLNTGKDEALQAGMYFKHLNQSGDLNQQKFSRQQLGVFGRSILNDITLNGEINYDRCSNFFYGANQLPIANVNAEKQSFNHVELKGELLSNYSDDKTFSYAIKPTAYLWNNKFDARENSFALSGFLNKAVNQFNFGLNASVDMTSAKDEAYNIGNHIFRANPYAKLQGDNYKLTLGLNLVQEFGFQSRTNVLPAVTVEFPIVPQYATLFGGATGNVNKTSLKDLSIDNPYLNAGVNIRNSIEKLNIYAGVKGNAGAGFGYKATAYHKTITDMPFFVSNVNSPQKFDVVYDNGNSKIIGFEGEISVNASETFTWTGKLIANEYDLTSQQQAWYKPEFQLVSNAKLSVNKKLTVDGEVLLNGETKARTYSYTTSTPQEMVADIKSYIDLSAGAEYRFQEKIGLYIRVNNIFSNKYQQYLYYPKYGLNVFGGFNYSF